jgi:hypothetical protein
MSVKKDYDLLAQAVACEYCGAHKGEACRRAGSRGLIHIKGTHYARRWLAARIRRKS